MIPGMTAQALAENRAGREALGLSKPHRSMTPASVAHSLLKAAVGNASPRQRTSSQTSKVVKRPEITRAPYDGAGVLGAMKARCAQGFRGRSAARLPQGRCGHEEAAQEGWALGAHKAR